MPTICGIELKGNAAIVVLLQGEASDFTILSTKAKKITLIDSNQQEDVKAFYNAIHAFLEAHKVDAIGIKGRATKGKFAGGAVSFKIEGLLQQSNYPVSILAGATLKAKLKDKELDCSAINNYQIEAMKVAYCLLLQAAS